MGWRLQGPELEQGAPPDFLPLTGPQTRRRPHRTMRPGPGPEHVLAEGREWVLLVVAEDLEHDGLALDVLDEGLGHLHGNLVARWAGDQRGA